MGLRRSGTGSPAAGAFAWPAGGAPLRDLARSARKDTQSGQSFLGPVRLVRQGRQNRRLALGLATTCCLVTRAAPLRIASLAFGSASPTASTASANSELRSTVRGETPC